MFVKLTTRKKVFLITLYYFLTWLLTIEKRNKTVHLLPGFRFFVVSETFGFRMEIGFSSAESVDVLKKSDLKITLM